MNSVDEDQEQDYKKFAILYCKSIQEGDHKTVNEQYKKLEKIRMKFEKDIENGKEFFQRLLDSPDYRVQYYAAVQSKMLGINIAKSNKLLKKISKRKDVGITRLNAEMSLKNWKL